MQVFKVFFKILSKNKTTLIMYTVIYLIMTMVINYSIQEKGEMAFSRISLDIGVENQDLGKMGDALVEYLGTYHHLQDIPKGKEALQDAIYYQEIDYVLIIPKDFTERFTNGERKGLLEGRIVPGSNTASLLDQEIESFLKTAAMYLVAGCDLEKAIHLTQKDIEQEVTITFLEETNEQYLPNIFYFFQYIPYVFLIMMILGVGSVMKTFKNKDLDARNKCSAMPFLKQNMQIFLGCMVYMILVYLVFMTMAYFNGRDYMFTIQGALSAINVLVFSICALSIAWFAVQFVRSAAELTIMSNIFGLGFSFLGGVFVSLDIMSETSIRVAKFIPSYWYVIANHNIQKITSFADATNIYESFLIVLMFALAFFTAGLLVRRLKMRSL